MFYTLQIRAESEPGNRWIVPCNFLHNNPSLGHRDKLVRPKK